MSKTRKPNPKGKKENEPRKIATLDFETDPFRHGRFPQPFACGFYDGHVYESIWGDPKTVTDWAVRKCRKFGGIIYAHNGGRFDFLGILFRRAGPTLYGEPVNSIAGRIVSVKFGESELRDSYAILPAPLSNYDKGEIDYRWFEKSCRQRYRKVILQYLRRDCISLYRLVDAFIGKHGTAPLTAASAAMRYMKTLGIKIDKLGEKQDEKFRKYYAGGLVLARRPGVHRGAFTVYDIKSAYPHAMVHAHAASNTFTFVGKPRNIEPSGFYVVAGMADECFLRRTKEGNRFGGCGLFHVTGWELLLAKSSGRFKGRIILGEIPDRTVDFKPYVNEFFEQKQAAEASGDKAGRVIAKIMLNALYGKFAQRPDGYRDYLLMPDDPQDDSLYRMVCGCHDSECKKWHVEAIYDDGHFAVWGKPSVSFNRYNVATAASITGFVRAQLMQAIYETDPYYCDTDSVIVDKKTHMPGQSGLLGGWGREVDGDLLYIAGKKLYALRIVGSACPDSDTARNKGYYWDGRRGWKIASKGCRLTPTEMRDLCAGKEVRYENPAPSYSLLNSPFFVKRTIRRTASNSLPKTETK
jgi:hypothetical protein